MDRQRRGSIQEEQARLPHLTNQALAMPGGHGTPTKTLHDNS